MLRRYGSFLRDRVVGVNARARRMHRALRTARQRLADADRLAEAGDLEPRRRRTIGRSADIPRRRRRWRVRRPAFGRIERRAAGLRRQLNIGGAKVFGVAFVEEQGIALVTEDQRALRAEERLVVIVERVRLDRRERSRASAWI